MEKWKQIKECDYYFISTEGNFKSCDRIIKTENGKTQLWKGEKIKPTKQKNGYLNVYMRINGKRCVRKLHRLVAETFIPNPENKHEVDHIDGNKENNKVENLRWVTHKENSNNPVTIEKFKNKIVSVETRKKMSTFAKTRTGKKNPNWKGGISLK